MKTIHIKNYISRMAGVKLLLLCLLVFASCEDSGDKIYLSGLEESDFIVTANEVVLSKETAKKVVLSTAWTTGTLVVSNPDMSAPDVLKTYIQISTDEEFTSNVIEVEGLNQSKAYAGAELNTITKNLGMEPDVAKSVYFRVRSSVGENLASAYSETQKVTITPYFIDMSFGFVLDAGKENTERILISPEINGVYSGFMGATGWYNFFLEEGDGSIWGNAPIDGSAFLASSVEDCWNFWFPGIGGCYYTVVDTNRKEWSSLLLPELKVSGDLEAEMEFSRPELKWKHVFEATEAKTIHVKLNSAGKQYNYATGVDDEAAVNTPVAFAPGSNGIVMASQAENIALNIPQAGEYTLVVDLSDPYLWTCTLVSGAPEPEPVIYDYLYLPGIDDGISGDWTFDNFLTLYNQDELLYAGVFNVNSLWGYSINVEDGNWEDKYQYADGDAYNGTVAFQSGVDFPAPDAGLYLMELSLNDLTYQFTALGSQIWITGMDDKWDLKPLDATATPGVYSGQMVVSDTSPWGIEIHLDDSWGHKYGGNEGMLYYQGSSITDVETTTPGTYTVTVDLLNGTYTIIQ